MIKLLDYSHRINRALLGVSDDSVEIAIAIIKKALIEKSVVFLIGNGGSASTASHFATDLQKLRNANFNRGSALSLCDNSSIITAIGNDESFDSIFITQLEALAKPNDVLIAYSASGNSNNIIKAVEWANLNRLTTIALSGFDGGKLLSIAPISIFTRTVVGDYGVAEDCHSIISHFMAEKLRES